MNVKELIEILQSLPQEATVLMRNDLNILVDAPAGTTLFEICGASIALNESLGIRIDLHTPGELAEKFRDQVLKEARPL